MSFEPLDYLRHILTEADYLMKETDGLSREAFFRSETLQRAFVRSLEVIGEASGKLPDGFRQQHTGVSWRAMAAMRNRLIHAYFGVDYELVWDIVQHRIPELRNEIASILNGR